MFQGQHFHWPRDQGKVLFQIPSGLKFCDSFLGRSEHFFNLKLLRQKFLLLTSKVQEQKFLFSSRFKLCNISMSRLTSHPCWKVSLRLRVIGFAIAFPRNGVVRILKPAEVEIGACGEMDRKQLFAGSLWTDCFNKRESCCFIGFLCLLRHQAALHFCLPPAGS